MPLYTGIDGVNREIMQSYTGINGVNREISQLYAGIDGANREIFTGETRLYDINGSQSDFESNFISTNSHWGENWVEAERTKVPSPYVTLNSKYGENMIWQRSAIGHITYGDHDGVDKGLSKIETRQAVDWSTYFVEVELTGWWCIGISFGVPVYNIEEYYAPGAYPGVGRSRVYPNLSILRFRRDSIGLSSFYISSDASYEETHNNLTTYNMNIYIRRITIKRR